MNQIEKKREREKQLLQESCLRLYDLLENEKETEGGVDRNSLITRKITLDGAWWKEASMPLLLTDKEGKQYMAIPSRGGRYCVRRD